MHTAGHRPLSNCLKNFKGRKKDNLGRAPVSPVIVRTLQLVIALCRYSAINFLHHLEYDEPHNRPRPTFFHGFKIEDDGKASCTIPPRNLLRTPATVPTKETALLTNRLCPPAGPHWHKQRRWCFDTCSNFLSHSSVDLRFSAGSTGERIRLHIAPRSCTCKLSGRDAVMVLSSWLWIFSSGVPRHTSTSDGPMDIFR